METTVITSARAGEEIEEARLDPWSIGLWSAAVLLAAMSFPAANWTDSLGLVPVVAAAGLVLGFILIRSRLSETVAALLGLGYGAVFVFWEMTSVLDPGMLWRERVLNLVGRLGVFFTLILSGQPSRDALMFVFLMASTFWWIGVLGTWLLFRRHQLWLALLLPGLAVFLNVYFYRFGERLQLYLPLFVLAALALIVRTEFNERRERWERLRAQVPTDLAGRMAQTGVVVALLLVGVAWVWPSITGSGAETPGPTASGYSPVGDFFSDALAGLRSPVNLYGETFGDVLALGAGRDPGQTAVFQASLDQAIPAGSRLYWRARVFDTYQGHEWKTSQGEPVSFRPRDDNVVPQPGTSRIEIDAVIWPFNPATKLLYVPAQLDWLNRSAELRAIRDQGQIVDVLEASSDQIIVPGETYRSRSEIAAPTVAQLRGAGIDYPEWVTAGYLQLPEDFPATVEALAQEIARSATNPYDKAAGVTDWLRRNITYQRVTESPPPGVEPVEWFLFTSKTGFCDYYASAAVLMLRSLGVPARMAVGYASGTYDPDTDRYYISAADSHSWPEVYFPGYGWVEFEPTVSQPELVRPAGSAAAGAGSAAQPENPEGAADNVPAEGAGDALRGIPEGVDVPAAIVPVVDYLPYAAIVLLIAIAAVTLTPARTPAARLALLGTRRAGLRVPGWLRDWATPPTTEAARVYRRLAPWPARLGLSPSSEDRTPHERAEVLAAELPESRGEISAIADGYAAERYGGRTPERGSSARAWRTLRLRLYVAALSKVADGLLGRE
jgi:hypothetical protein